MEEHSTQQLFKRWKKGAFLMKVCEQLYTYLLKEKEESVEERFFYEWARLFRHKVSKDQQFQSLATNHQYHFLKQGLEAWRSAPSIKGRVMAMKLERVFGKVYVDGMESIYQYSEKEKQLTKRLEKYQRAALK